MIENLPTTENFKSLAKDCLIQTTNNLFEIAKNYIEQKDEVYQDLDENEIWKHHNGTRLSFDNRLTTQHYLADSDLNSRRCVQPLCLHVSPPLQRIRAEIPEADRLFFFVVCYSLRSIHTTTDHS